MHNVVSSHRRFLISVVCGVDNLVNSYDCIMLQRIFISTGIILLAACLRLWQINSAPLGLNYDEALNGLVSSQILNGEHPALLVLDDSREHDRWCLL